MNKILLTLMLLLTIESISAQIVKYIAPAAAATLAAIQKANAKKKQQQAQQQNQQHNQAQQQNREGNTAYDFSGQPVQNYQADLSGTWEGQQINGNLLMYYKLCLSKNNGNTYSGFDYCIWQKSLNGAPLNVSGDMPKGEKTFVANFDGQTLTVTEMAAIENTNWGTRNEYLMLVNDNGTLKFINNNKGEPARKFLLKRTGDFPKDYSKYLINNASINISDVAYYNPAKSSVIKYNENGRIDVKVKNTTAINFKQIDVNVIPTGLGTDENNYKKVSLSLAGNAEQDFNTPYSSDFSLPNDSVRFTINASLGGVVVAQKYFALPSESFFKTDDVIKSSYSTARMKAVNGFYGLLNTPYQSVAKNLDPLVAQGDAMAAMWKGIFLHFGFGEYKTDEDAGYKLCKANIKTIENKARNGDAEALYLMFYICNLGLEGDNAKPFGKTFLKKSADAGFAPAVYDNGIEHYLDKDYANAVKYLFQSYAEGVTKAAEVIGVMYEKGYGVDANIDSAIAWYNKGIAFGDPAAMLMYAYLHEKGFKNSPPDIHKAMDIASKAALKNYTWAMIFNGRIYYNGKEGISKNIPTAVKWLKQAADLGDAEAMLELGIIYDNDNPGFAKDENSAFFWLKKSAEAGCGGAMIMLSRFYRDGGVAEQDVVKSRYWYNQSVLKGVGQQNNDALNAGMQDFSNFWNSADFSPSYYLVNGYNDVVGDSGDGFINGMVTGVFGMMFSRYANPQEQINGLEFIQEKKGKKIYGGTLSSYLLSSLNLSEGQSVNVNAYGIISTGSFSGPANANGLGDAWPEYRMIKTIPCSAVMAEVKDADWQFIGQKGTYMAPKSGPLAFAVNGIDYMQYKGYFDIVVEVADN